MLNGTHQRNIFSLKVASAQFYSILPVRGCNLYLQEVPYMKTKTIQVKKRNGRLEKLDINKINLCAERACGELENVSASEVVIDAHIQLYDKITTKEIDSALIMSARAKLEKEPNYSLVASRLLLGNLYKEVFGSSVDRDSFDHQYCHQKY